MPKAAIKRKRTYMATALQNKEIRLYLAGDARVVPHAVWEDYQRLSRMGKDIHRKRAEARQLLMAARRGILKPDEEDDAAEQMQKAIEELIATGRVAIRDNKMVQIERTADDAAETKAYPPTPAQRRAKYPSMHPRVDAAREVLPTPAQPRKRSL